VLNRSSAALLIALMGLAAWLRTRSLDGTLWIDEALSRGIALHAVTDIPGLLRQDGSPPLYYLVLHGWMELVGDGEAALRALSVVFAVACVPASYWAGQAAGGARTGRIAAALAALTPFLTIYGQEARMYSLVALLSIVATGALVRGFVDGSRAFQAVFAATVAALLYTHAWALFVVPATLVALALVGRDALRSGAVALAAALVVFAPWLPVLVDQARETGAPWSQTPSPWNLLGALPQALAGGLGALALVAVAVGGLAYARRDDRVRRLALALAALAGATVVTAWLASQLTPSWANRYLAVLVGPVVVLASLGLARAGRVGILALVALAALWIGYRAPADKSNAAELAARLGPVKRGTLVVSAQPEGVPLLAYYLGGARYASPLGPADARVMDWRDALRRLSAATPESALAPLEGELRRGDRLVLVTPLEGQRGWAAPWQREVLERAAEWRRHAEESSRLRRVREIVPPPSERARTDVKATVYERL
jgi:hypothetical protein